VVVSLGSGSDADDDQCYTGEVMQCEDLVKDKQADDGSGGEESAKENR
jgi:hypothetical protein